MNGDADAERAALIERLREANEKLVAASVRSLELADQADAARRRAELLDEATTQLNVSLDYDATLAAIARLAIPAFADWCFVDMIDSTGSVHRLEVAHADPSEAALASRLQRFPPREDGSDAPARALVNGYAVLVADYWDETIARAAQDPEHLDAMRMLRPRSSISAPLIARGRTQGILTLLFTDRSKRQYGADDVPLAVELARRCALALDNARLYGLAEESSRLKDEFLATLSHELRTPLNAILGWARMLRAGMLPEASRQRALETIERNAKTQAHLIEDLLDVSRISSGRLRLTLEPMDLGPALAEAIEVAQPMAEAKGVALDVVIEPDMPPVAGDAARLQQVFWNVLSNAVKFTPKDGRITVRLERRGPAAELRISDDGEGIPPDFLPHVFDPFRQAEAGPFRTHAGLGLGLAIVRQLVELHGGTVSADSPGKGHGATIRIALPLAAAAAPLSAAPEAAHPLANDGAPVTFAGVRVLVVEDDPDARELLGIVFRESGAIVTTVASVDQALDVIGEGQSDAVVADIGLPERDGYDLIREIRGREQGHAGHMPAIAVTARAGGQDRREAIEAGYDDYVGKPIEPDRVAAVLASAMRRPTARDAS